MVRTGESKLELNHREAVPVVYPLSCCLCLVTKAAGTVPSRWANNFTFLRAFPLYLSILFFTSLLAIPLARQGCLDATLFARLQVIGVTFYFLDDVLLLHFPLEAP